MRILKARAPEIKHPIGILHSAFCNPHLAIVAAVQTA
jgi:hypothetical protein